MEKGQSYVDNKPIKIVNTEIICSNRTPGATYFLSEL